MSADSQYDVIIVGAGPGGYVAALRAARLGGRVALVERDLMGGTCLNRGCIPTKALISGAERLQAIRDAGRFGIETGDVAVSLPRLMRHKEKVVASLRSGVEHLCKAAGVQVHRGDGRLSGPGKVVVADGGSETELSGRAVILATGSYACGIPVTGCSLGMDHVATSDDMLRLQEVPRRLTVIGAGAVGVEFSYIFNQLGSRVTLIEALDRVMPPADEEVSREMEKALSGQGIRVITSACVQRVDPSDDGMKVVLSEEGPEDLRADLVMLAVGRRPCLEGLGLEEAGVAFDGKGVVVDERMETGVSGIYAIGDITGRMQLAHVASAQGLVAAANALGGDARMDYRAVPSCVYASPEAAWVGLTEREAREMGRQVKVGRFPFRHNGRALAMGEGEGFVKIVADARFGEVLGAHVFGPQATTLIGELALAMRAEVTVNEIAQAIHAHPTLSEAANEAAWDVLGLALHK